MSSSSRLPLEDRFIDNRNAPQFPGGDNTCLGHLVLQILLPIELVVDLSDETEHTDYDEAASSGGIRWFEQFHQFGFDVA